MRFEELEEVEAQLKELEYLVKKCRIHYEQFFMGVEKREPVDLRRKIQTFLKNSPFEKHRKASIKFRALTLTQKFVTLTNYWDRILRSMEDGTFNYMAYRGFRPRSAAEDAAVDVPTKEALRIDPEEVEREAIAHLAERWGEQRVVDDQQPEPPPLEATADEVRQVFPGEPGAPEPGEPQAPRAPSPAPEPRPEPRREPTTPTPEVRPSLRPTVLLDGAPPQRPSAPTAQVPPPTVPVTPPSIQAPRAGAPTITLPPRRAAKPAAPPTAPVAQTPRPGEALEGIPGARRLYDKYRQAKVNAIADSEDLSYEQFEDRLVKKRDMLKQKFQQDFEFDVIAREGKVSIVAKKR